MFLNNHDYLQDHEVYTYKYTKTYLWVALGFSFIIGFFLIFFIILGLFELSFIIFYFLWYYSDFLFIKLHVD
jgi:hypothetical protein